MELDISKYKNFLDLITVNSDDVMQEISTFSKIPFDEVYNYHVEKRLKLPIYITPFYKFVKDNKHVPNLSEFLSCYLKMYKEYFKKGNFNNVTKRGIKARLKRSYPSLLRDLHLCLYLRENMKDVDIIFNSNLDVKEGIDILINDGEYLFGISLFTYTKNSLDAREDKKNRHATYSNINYIEIPLMLYEYKKSGDIYLYGEEDMIKIKNRMVNKIKDIEKCII